jgi:hypothetical protein
MQPSPPLPEDVLIATFNRVGNVRLEDNSRLAEIFDKARQQVPAGPFDSFRLHPRYGYSRVLSDTLQILDHAGSIVRENATQQYFRPTPHTLGGFGESLYRGLSLEHRQVIDQVAEQIRNDFTVIDEQQTQTVQA